MAVCRVVHGPHTDGSGECHIGVASMGRLPKRSAFVRALDDSWMLVLRSSEGWGTIRRQGIYS